jgi:hypothetical protein
MVFARVAAISSVLMLSCSSSPDAAEGTPASGGTAGAATGGTAGAATGGTGARSFADISVPWPELAPDPTSSYSAELVGDSVGNGTLPIESTRKRVALETNPANLAAQLSVTFGAAYLLRATSDPHAQLIAALKNVGTTILCDRELSIANIYAADGSAIAASSTSVTTVGSSGEVTNSASSQPREYIDSCIAAGSVGYFVTEFPGAPTLFDRAAAVRIQLAKSPSASTFADITGSVSPTAYAFDGKNIVFTIHNGTIDPIRVWETLFLALDADGLPLGWSRGAGTVDPFGPDTSAMTLPNGLGYAGPPTTRLRVFAEFDYRAVP